MIGTRISYNTSLNTMTIFGGKTVFFLKRYHQFSTDPLHHTLMRSCEAQLQGKGAIPNTRFLNFNSYRPCSFTLAPLALRATHYT